MRTTLDIDDALLSRAQALFPAGTPKTVLLEEGLRRLLASSGDVPSAPPRKRDPRMQRLIDEGLVRASTVTGPLGPRDVSDAIPLAQLLADLDGDREDR